MKSPEMQHRLIKDNIEIGFRDGVLFAIQKVIELISIEGKWEERDGELYLVIPNKLIRTIRDLEE